ncbi:MAG: hypothetical protein ACE5Z5_10695, partial [Candidatus Bathyarchaeia archaeon]
MELATRIENGLVAGFFSGSFAFAIYSQQSTLTGVLIGSMTATLTFAFFVRKKRDPIRRVFIITLSIIVWTGFFAIATFRGFGPFVKWSGSHARIPIIPSGPTS